MSLLRPHDQQDGRNPIPFRPLILLGASVRAAVQSASLAQLTPYAVDSFGDLDTRENSAFWTKLDTQIHACTLLNSHPYAPIIATGGIESLIDWIEPLRQNYPVLIPSKNTLNTLRDPVFLHTAAKECGWIFPQWQRHPPNDNDDWLKKNSRSAGGCEVIPWRPNQWKTHSTTTSSEYFQKRVRGTAWGANFLATPDQVFLVGVSRSLRHALGPRKYLYAGSIGPINVPGAQVQQLLSIGDWVRRNTDLRGLFGIDLLYESENTPPKLLEINPRYTSSMELWERAHGRSLLEAHQACFQPTSPLPNDFHCVSQSFKNLNSANACSPFLIKRILWARNNVRWHRASVEASLAELNADANRTPPLLCDYPADSTVIPGGCPIATWIFGPFRPAEPFSPIMSKLHRQLSALENALHVSLLKH